MAVIRNGDKSFPEGFGFSCWGLATLEPGQESDYHFHDCDEYWFILEGRGLVTEDGVDYEVGPGDTVFTPMGSEHRLKAATRLTEFWCECTQRGRKRPGHLIAGRDERP